MGNYIAEPIDLNNPMPTKCVIGYDTNKRKTFNQMMSDSFNSVKDKIVLNTLFERMTNNIIQQDTECGRTKELLLMRN